MASFRSCMLEWRSSRATSTSAIPMATSKILSDVPSSLAALAVQGFCGPPCFSSLIAFDPSARCIYPYLQRPGHHKRCLCNAIVVPLRNYIWPFLILYRQNHSNGGMDGKGPSLSQKLDPIEF